MNKCQLIDYLNVCQHNNINYILKNIIFFYQIRVLYYMSAIGAVDVINNGVLIELYKKV